METLTQPKVVLTYNYQFWLEIPEAFNLVKSKLERGQNDKSFSTITRHVERLSAANLDRTTQPLTKTRILHPAEISH